MSKVFDVIATGLVVFLIGCSTVVETNEQACVRANTKLFTCLFEDISGLAGVVALGLEEQAVLDEFLQGALEFCADQPETLDCNWRPLADCLTGVTCEELGGGEGFGTVCDEVVGSVFGCQGVGG